MCSVRNLIMAAVLLATATMLARAAMRGLADEQPWRAPDREARKANPVAADDNSIADGKKNYQKQCQLCHGAEGKGDGPMSSTLPRSPGDLSSAKMREQTDGELFWKITTGKPPMAAYAKTLNENERWNVVNYIRTMEPKEEKK